MKISENVTYPLFPLTPSIVGSLTIPQLASNQLPASSAIVFSWWENVAACFLAETVVRRGVKATKMYKDYYAFTETLMDIDHACSNWRTVKSSTFVATRKLVYRHS